MCCSGLIVLAYEGQFLHIEPRPLEFFNARFCFGVGIEDSYHCVMLRHGLSPYVLCDTLTVINCRLFHRHTCRQWSYSLFGSGLILLYGHPVLYFLYAVNVVGVFGGQVQFGCIAGLATQCYDTLLRSDRGLEGTGRAVIEQTHLD